MNHTKREFSAGLVVYKKEKNKYFFLIGKHSGYYKWVLPKGLIEKDETGWQTAQRETEEEMGVKARILNKKPIHLVKYVYYADLKKQEKQNNKKRKKPEKRVAKYQEAGGKKTKIFKSVSFYIGEYVSGDPKDHDWEMKEAGWYDYKKALSLLDFKGEKEALEKAFKRLQDLEKQPKLL